MTSPSTVSRALPHSAEPSAAPGAPPRVREPDLDHGGPIAATDLETFTELASVDEARSVTWPRRSDRRTVTPDQLDFLLLGWLTELRFALATQIHRTFFADKSYSTTQRRLKRMHQAGWVERFQFFQRQRILEPARVPGDRRGDQGRQRPGRPARPLPAPQALLLCAVDERPIMRRARHDVHVVAWVLALQATLGDRVRQVRGPRSGYLAPPWRTVHGERHDYAPDDLKLPGGRTPARLPAHRQGRRARVAVERFEPLEAHAPAGQAVLCASRRRATPGRVSA